MTGDGVPLKAAEFSGFSGSDATCLSAASKPISHRLAAPMRTTFNEMGIGRGGKIVQKIYPDPHGLDVWEPSPWTTLACYLVNAEAFEEITGEKIQKPVSSENYAGPWFGLKDAAEGDIPGTHKFTGLKSAVFPASTPQPDAAPVLEPVTTKSSETK